MNQNQATPKTAINEFARDLENAASLLRQSTTDQRGSKARAKEARLLLTEIKKNITAIKRATLEL